MLLGSGGPPGIINKTLPSAAQITGANWALTNSGTYSIDLSGTPQTGSWVTPNGNASLFDVKTVVTAGAFTVDPSAGSFLNMGTSRTWTKVGSGTVIFTVTFRVAATGQIVNAQTGVQIVIP